VLRHAAGDAEATCGRALVARELAEAAEHARLGVLADRARVEQDDVRRVGRVDAP
jgi:hypothetical protein